MHHDPEASRLIDRAKSGDQDAFGELYRRHLPRVVRIVGRMLGPSAELEEVVQEVFIKVFRSLGTFEHRSAFSTWIVTVARNVCLSHIARQHVTTVACDVTHIPAASIDAWRRLDARERLRTLHRVLEGQPREQREAFVLHHIEGLTLAEVAQTLQRPPGTVAAWVSRSRQAIKVAFRQAERRPKVILRGRG